MDVLAGAGLDVVESGAVGVRNLNFAVATAPLEVRASTAATARVS